MATKESSKDGRKAASAPKAQKRPLGQSGRGATPKASASHSGEKPPILDDRSRRDIAAVILVVLAIALFATAALSPTGVVTGALSGALRLSLGIGVYILPFVLAGIALTFVVRFHNQRVPARVAIGLGLIFFGLLVLLALMSPGAQEDPNSLFIQAVLVTHGGYVGAGVAWAALELFGMTVSLILVVGLMVVALIIIGFSFSALIEKVRDKTTTEATEESGTFEHLPRYSFARIRKGRAQARPDDASSDRALSPNGPGGALGLDQAQTHRLGAKRVHEADTQLLTEGSSHKTPAKRAAAKKGTSLAAAETIALNAKESPQMTRKLSSRSDSGEPARQASKKVPSSATPEPQDGFILPEKSLLKTSSKKSASSESEATLRTTAALLQETLADFGVNASVVGWVAGPTVTLFKIDLPAGVRVSRVSNLNDDIALALASPGVRIFAPVPGTNYVGIEVPNKKRETVLLGDVLKDAPKGPLQVAIGKDVEGRNIVSDLAKMPHLLIGGTTGSGKSVSINGMIMSILMRATPSEVRMIMIDPKRVEFTPYNDIPHLYVPVVTEAREAASALSWAVAEMERRLKVFSGIGARNIGQYNAKAQQGVEIEGTPAQEMPYIVIIIDELADLMMNVGKEVEFSISRLAQLARAAGIHLIVATQRPSTNVVTGLIKANITNRIAFNVASGIDSRVILDTPGAENLIGLGDLLLSKPELPKPQRIQGCFVSEEEIAAVVEKLKEQGNPDYHHDILKTNLITLGDSSPDGSGGSGASADDPLVWDAAEIVVSSGMGSTSNLQRRLSVGYSRAGRIMDLLEEKGIVGPPNGSKPREVLINDPLELETIKAFEQADGE